MTPIKFLLLILLLLLLLFPVNGLELQADAEVVTYLLYIGFIVTIAIVLLIKCPGFNPPIGFGPLLSNAREQCVLC